MGLARGVQIYVSVCSLWVLPLLLVLEGTLTHLPSLAGEKFKQCNSICALSMAAVLKELSFLC